MIQPKVPSVQPVLQSPVPPSTNWLKFLLFTLLGLVLAVGLVFAGVQIGKNQIENCQATVTQPTTLPTQVPELTESVSLPSTADPNRESYSEATGKPNQFLYVSPKLGISFLYLAKEDGLADTFATKEIRNRVYIYSNRSESYENGQYIEVFEKDSLETLESTITKQFLTGKNLSECYVTVKKMGSNKYPDTYVTAEIDFPMSDDEGMEELLEKTEKCSPNYARTNGLRYFVEDRSHPSKYAFVSVGQDVLPAESSNILLGWHDTIKFIN